MGGYFTRRRLRCAFFWSFLAAVAIAAAGCSGETSRFGENANSNPYAARASSRQPAVAPIAPTRTVAVESQPLPQVQAANSPYAPQYAALQYEPPQYAPPQYAPPAPQYVPPQSVPPQQMTPYAPPPPQYTPQSVTPYAPPPRTPQYTPPPSMPAYAPPAPRPAPDVTASAGGGAKIAHAAAPRAPASASLPAAPAAMPTAVVGSSAQTLLPIPPVHTVASGDTLGKVAHRYRVSVREIVVANGIAAETPLKVGMRLTIPVRTGVPPGAYPGRPQPGAPIVAQAKPITVPQTYAPAPQAPGRIASSESAANVRLASPVETPSGEVGPNGAPGFRWPLRGRIVSNFGARVNGSPNDGIDLAVPEGTQVRAADDGVVAYAGNELKGYGNLVLVRHANGFVTAYANGSELLVKRNDQVHKGQVILKSGQTGNAAAPQLHFEVRKNSAPVDPMQFLPADKTASAPL